MIKDKILSASCLKRVIAQLRKNKKTIAFTNGCFDLLHYGHVRYLEQAKAKADVLLVGLNSDLSVNRIKGPQRPIVRQRYRALVLAGLASIDYVVLFNEATPINLIKKVKPDFMIKGANWKKSDIVGSNFVESYGGRVVRLKFASGFSTTNLINDILKKSVR